MEKRLAEFRNLKAARQGSSSQASKIRPSSSSSGSSQHEQTPEETNISKFEKGNNDEEKRFQETLRKQRERLGIVANCDEEDNGLSFWNRHVEKILKFLLWICLQGFFIQIEFGAVYFVASLAYFMYISMRSGSGRPGPSAYSVFNKDCERIHGTFTAEQFESQLRHGGGATSSN
eukprot:gene6212-6927_t